MPSYLAVSVAVGGVEQLCEQLGADQKRRIRRRHILAGSGLQQLVQRAELRQHSSGRQVGQRALAVAVVPASDSPQQ